MGIDGSDHTVLHASLPVLEDAASESVIRQAAPREATAAAMEAMALANLVFEHSEVVMKFKFM